MSVVVGRRCWMSSTPAIRAMLAEHPRMPAAVIAERIGWARSLTVLDDRVRELRPWFAVPDPCGRTEYRPGELAQWDVCLRPVEVALGFDQVACLTAGAGRGVGL